MKKKICIVVGTRPEIIRLSVIIKKFRKYFDTKLVHTGQNNHKKLNDIFFSDLNLKKPDVYLNSRGKNASETIANIFKSFDKYLSRNKFDAIFILGDTNSALCSLVAKKKKIPVFHYEAGNRCFDNRVPEEINRKVIDTVSDINITYSLNSKQNLINEGFSNDKIFNIGSPMYEVINDNISKIKKSLILSKINLKKNDYILASIHREENVDDGKILKKLLNSLQKISNKYSKKIIFSTHPRTKIMIKNIKFKSNQIHFVEPFCFSDYLNLQLNSFITISDSGTINEESSILNFKAINLRETNERQESMCNGVTVMTGFDFTDISNAIDIELNTNNSKNVGEYNNDVSDICVKLVLSYIQYVNRTNLFKY